MFIYTIMKQCSQRWSNVMWEIQNSRSIQYPKKCAETELDECRPFNGFKGDQPTIPVEPQFLYLTSVGLMRRWSDVSAQKRVVAHLRGCDSIWGKRPECIKKEHRRNKLNKAGFKHFKMDLKCISYAAHSTFPTFNHVPERALAMPNSSSFFFRQSELFSSFFHSRVFSCAKIREFQHENCCKGLCFRFFCPPFPRSFRKGSFELATKKCTPRCNFMRSYEKFV